jgi:iron complex transport system substrate-binding protein
MRASEKEDTFGVQPSVDGACRSVAMGQGGSAALQPGEYRCQKQWALAPEAQARAKARYMSSLFFAGLKPSASTVRRTVGWLVSCCLLLMAAHAAHARTLTDELGRAVAIAEHPHHIVCLAPSLTDTVYALGHGGDVAGITDYTEYPAEARKKPSVGGVIDPSLETIVALQPDLVLAIAEMNSYDTIRALERVHVPVFVVQPKGMEGAYRSILSVGDALNDAVAARALVEGLRARQRQIAARMAGKPRPTVLLVLWPDPFITAGRGAFITDLIEAAGAQSVTADVPQEWSRMSLESIIARKPEYLLLIRGNKVTPEELTRLPGWSSLAAVHAHRVIWVDDRIYYASPLMLDALEDLSQQLLAAQTSR